MGLDKILRNTVSIIKDEPIDAHERIDHLDRKLSNRIMQLEETLASIHGIVEKLSEENSLLKQENDALKQSLGNREIVANSMLDGIKQKLVTPLLKEGEDLAKLVFEDEPKKEEASQEEIKKNMEILPHLEPDTDLSKGKAPNESNPVQNDIKKELKLREEKTVLKKQNNTSHEAKHKTITWMRGKFGLGPLKQAELKTSAKRKSRSKSTRKTKLTRKTSRKKKR